MSKEAYTMEDYSLRDVLEARVQHLAQGLFEDLKSFCRHPEEMDDVKVKIELKLLKPISTEEDNAGK